VSNRPPKTGGRLFEIDGWDVSVHEEGDGALEWAKTTAAYLININAPDRVLKHDHRSLVELVHIGGAPYIVKKFTLQRTWFWFQLTSTAFPTLGEIACSNALALSQIGLMTPRPSLLMQRVEQGMVVESWLVYPYLDGRPATVADAPELVAYVKRMHEAGWIHRDPHPGNFIITDSGLATLDPIKARRNGNRYLKAYDVVLMANDYPEAIQLYGRERLGPWLPLARSGHSIVRYYRKTKRGIRRIMGIKGNAGSFN